LPRAHFPPFRLLPLQVRFRHQHEFLRVDVTVNVALLHKTRLSMPRFTTVSVFPESHRACASPFVHNDVCAFCAVLRMLRGTYMQFSRTARVPCSSLSSRQHVKREWDSHSASRDSRLLTSSSLPTTTQICSSTRRTNGVLFTWWSQDGRIHQQNKSVLAVLD
jgi:hypothetical protein